MGCFAWAGAVEVFVSAPSFAGTDLVLQLSAVVQLFESTPQEPPSETCLPVV